MKPEPRLVQPTSLFFPKIPRAGQESCDNFADVIRLNCAFWSSSDMPFRSKSATPESLNAFNLSVLPGCCQGLHRFWTAHALIRLVAARHYAQAGRFAVLRGA